MSLGGELSTTADVPPFEKMTRLLEEGGAVAAAELAMETSADLTDQSRLLLRIMDALYRERRDAELLQLIDRLEDSGVLPVERLIFMLRVRYRAEDYAGANQTLDRILEIAPHNVEALRVGGRIANLTKDDNAALRYWELLANAAPQDHEAALQAARLRLRHKKYDAALAWARQALVGLPGSEELVLIAVLAGEQQGWPEDCDQLLARLLPINRARALRIASSIVTSCTPEVAARMLAVLRREFVEDADISALADDACSRWRVKALELELASKGGEAAAYYEAIRLVYPDSKEIKRAIERLARPSLVAMREALSGRNFVEATKHGLAVTGIDRHCLEAWEGVARARFAIGDLALAVASYRKCTEINPEDPRTWLAYGLVLNQAGERLAALAAYRSALALAPGAGPREEIEASLSILFSALLADADASLLLNELPKAWTLYKAAASIRSSEGNIEQLRQQLVRKTKEDIRARWNAQSSGLIELCELFLHETPVDTYVQTVLARTLMKDRKYDRALLMWEELCSSHPSDSHFQLQIARCCRSLKLPSKGIQAAEKALKLDANLTEAAEIREYLRAQ